MGDYNEGNFSLGTPSETEGFDSWSSEQLAFYFKNNGLGQYSEALIEHKITGKLAPLLTDPDFKEMGIKCIGDRLRFRLHIDHLKHKVRAQTRTKCLWVGKERIFYTRAESTLCTLCGFCPVDPSTYKLMSSYMKIKTVNPARIGPIRLCCCNEYKVNNVDLTYVADVDVLGTPAPWCARVLCCAPGKDIVNIEIRGYGGDETMTHRLILKEGDGDTVAGMIMNSVEESQMIDRE
jgi:hypothetical protein